jgi:hypothetical protein
MLIFKGMILDNPIKHLLKVGLPCLLLTKQLKLARKLFHFVIFVFHLDELV